ncbi:MAG: YggS family pyridoxal phosphate-dependent enzyme [Leptospiraceae bacterium]|nr:YggS family pyridoxal phosphate-dependent enzyme [Leptospiraceae bacterium]
MSIRSNYEAIYSRISGVSRDVTIIAVSKTKPVELVIEAIESGIKVFGENRIQEGIEKFTELKKLHPDILLHHIGPVQSGTLKKLFGLFDFTHGVGSLSTLEDLSKQSLKLKKLLRFFLQINLTEEVSKSGFSETELLKVFPNLQNYETEYLRFHGFMTMGPTNEDKELTKKVFDKLSKIRNEISPNANLSMGMSGDFELALDSGTDYVRIGSAIFGSR